MAKFLLVVVFITIVISENCAPPSENDDVCDFSQFVSEVVPMEGFHVLCVIAEDKGAIRIRGHKNGYLHAHMTGNFLAQNLNQFRNEVENLVDMLFERRDSSNTYHFDITSRQPWGLFNSKGFRISNSLQEVLDSKIVLVYEGGQFIWPGVRVGFRRHIDAVHGKPNGVDLITLSLQPLVISINNFLEDGECDKIKSVSEEYMAPSPVAHKDGDIGKPATEWRTSTQHWLGSGSHPWLQAIDKRVGDLTRVPVNHQEHLQVLRYQKGEKYDAHHDFFDISHYQSSPDIQRMLHFGTNNRLATVFWYITDVAEGGSTWFPRGNGFAHPGLVGGASSYSSCEPNVGLHSYPSRGKVIIFYSLLANGKPDDLSLHAGCPPLSVGDTKWSANKWVWNKPQSYGNYE